MITELTLFVLYCLEKKAVFFKKCSKLNSVYLRGVLKFTQDFLDFMMKGKKGLIFLSIV